MQLLGSFRFVWFVRCALEFAGFGGSLGFFPVRLVRLGAAYESLGYFWVRLFLSGAPLGLLGSFRFVWFVRVRPGGRWVLSGLTCSYGCALKVAGFMGLLSPVAARVSMGSFVFVWFIRFRLVHPGAPWDRCFFPGASGSSTCALGVDWLVRVRLPRTGARLGLLVSFGFVWFVQVRPGGRLVRVFCMDAPLVSLGSFVWIRFVRLYPGCCWIRSGSSRLAGFGRVCLVRSSVPLWSLGSFGFH